MSQAETFCEGINFRQNRPPDCACGAATGREEAYNRRWRYWRICREGLAHEGASDASSGGAPLGCCRRGWPADDVTGA